MRRRRHRLDLPRRQGRGHRFAGVLARGVHPQRGHRGLRQTVCGDHGRHRDGRWGRGVGARQRADRHRAVDDRHARDRDRFRPRCRGHLPARPHPGRVGHPHRPDHRPAQCRRCDRVRFRRPLHPVGEDRAVPRRAVDDVGSGGARTVHRTGTGIGVAGAAGLDRRRVLGGQCRRHRRAAARQWGARGGEGGRAGALEVADRVRGHPDIAAPRTAGRQPRGSTQRRVPGVRRLPELARPRRGHPGAGRGQGPQPAVVARHHRGGRPSAGRRVLRPTRRPRTRAHPPTTTGDNQ